MAGITTIHRRRKRRNPTAENDLECIFSTFPGQQSTPPKKSVPRQPSVHGWLYRRSIYNGHPPTTTTTQPLFLRHNNNTVTRPLYCKKRTIDFGQLSHNNRVILGFNDSGDIILALSEDDHDQYSLQLYGLPSRLQESNTNNNENGTLSMIRLATIPLPLGGGAASNNNDHLFRHALCAPARIPTRILNLGHLWVVLYRPDYDSSHNSTTATTANALLQVVVQITGPTTSRFVLSNLHSPESVACNHVVLAVNSVPITRTGGDAILQDSNSTIHLQRTPAYLLLLDEEDGLRLTYIRHRDCYVPNKQEECVVKPLWTQASCDGKKVFRHGLRRIIESDYETSTSASGWQECTRGDYEIVTTLYLDVVLLLFDILTHLPTLVRPRFDGSKLPYFCYHLVQLYSDRVLEVLIVANVSTGHGCFGVFVQVDLLTHDYRICRCIRTRAYDTPTTKGTLKLAQQRRTKQSACMVFDNANVLRGRPVASLKARCAPVEMTYGSCGG